MKVKLDDGTEFEFFLVATVDSVCNNPEAMDWLNKCEERIKKHIEEQNITIIDPESPEMRNLWYGYRHEDGGIHVKRYFDPGDIREIEESDFVHQHCGPFLAEGRADAMEIAMGSLKHT